MSCTQNGDHRDIHSFPTRRSSDLKSGVMFKKFASILNAHGKELEDYTQAIDVANETFKNFGEVFTRSEEHTSELQSRGHLVCRLLLEKKNIKRSNQLK